MKSERHKRVATYVGEVVLGQHGVSGVGTIIVVEDNVLLIQTALDDLAGSSPELILDLVDDRDNERGDEREDEHGQLLLKLLYQLGEDGDVLDLLGDGLENLVVELDRRHYLLEDVLDVARVLFRLARRNLGLFHLGGVGVVLKLLHFALLVITAKQAIGNLVEQVAEKARVAALALLQRALELLDFILRQLVGDLTRHGVQEVNATKGTRHTGVHLVASAGELHPGSASDMREDVALAHLDEGKLAVVAVRQEICDPRSATPNEKEEKKTFVPQA